jgi:hypothetical protein
VRFKVFIAVRIMLFLWILALKMDMGCLSETLVTTHGSTRSQNPERHELDNFYSSPNIKMIKLSRMKWAGHTARTENQKCVKLWLESLKRKDNSENLGLGGRTVFIWILGK